MKKYEEKIIQQLDRVLVARICDRCGKEIADKSTYYTVTTSHSDWGNDSVDSIKYKDICSDDCLKKEINEYFEFDSDTKKIDIEKEINYI